MSDYDRDLEHIKIEETCITNEMVDQVDKEDYRYYYVDKNLSRPHMLEYYTPPEELLMITIGKKAPERMIYPLDGPFTKLEEDSYEELLDYFYDKGEELPEGVTKRRALRFLNGNSFDIKKTYENIIKHIEWRGEMKPFILSEGDMNLLDKGFIYIHGRDKNFRPILVINAKIIAGKGVDPDDVFNTAWFVCHYMIENILKRGSCENWVDIMDLGGLSFTKIPVKALKKFITESQVHMKSRIAKMFLLHVTWGIRTIYSIVSPFLEKRTKEKIIMNKGGYNEEILELAHPSQLEEKYGGEAENLTEFWPPFAISDEYGCDPDCINQPIEPVQLERRKVKKVRQKEVGMSLAPSHPVKFVTEPVDVVEGPKRKQAPKADKNSGCKCAIF
ncbi:unnamed protein product [Moneuplotes crassus]|uniref:CRAL-TRIO domain-containing protein n=1 Tax=Euplotes crassus TaxID=5936 RepID=A0AAD1UQZ4_EUPCR|nr:unnamed protein product [Moneuplotes crassus]